MIDRGSALSVTKQAEAAGIARSTVYYLPRLVPAADLELMRQIDRLHLEFPSQGRGCCAVFWLPVGARNQRPGLMSER